MSSVTLAGLKATSEAPINQQPLFSYAAGYPPLGVTSGGGTVSPNWNIFAVGVVTAGSTTQWIYEPLAIADYLTGNLYPWLATNWTFANGNRDFYVYLRHGVYFFYNGTWTNCSHVIILWPFTARDVVVTFQDYFKVYGNPFNVTVSMVNPYEVDFHFTKANVQYAYYTILVQRIVPWEQYSNLTNPASASITTPVGTGPFYLSSYSATQITLLRNPYYWIPGRPLIPQLVYLVGVSNAVCFSFLAEGKAQWGGVGSTGSTGFDKLFAYANPQYYHGMASIGNGSGGQTSFLWFNWVRLDYWPWNETWFRYALSLALNRTEISVGSQFGITTGAPPTPADFLPSPMEEIWLNSSVIQEAHAVDVYNLSGAMQILESHGLKLINGKLSFPNGTPLPSYTMINYQGFADTFATSTIIAEDLAKIGLQISVVSQPPSTAFGVSEPKGLYDLIYWLTSDYSPYIIWGQAFIPPLIPGTDQPNVTMVETIGIPIYTDPGRWIPPKQFIDLWIQAGNTTDVTQLKHIYNEMASILLQYRPAIPVVFDAYPRYEYEDQYYIGFSTPQYFYTSDVEPWVLGNLMMLVNLAPRPPGMTQQQEVAYTSAAYHDLLSFLYGTSSTATPSSLLAMLQPSSSSTSTTTSFTPTSSTTPPTSTVVTTTSILTSTATITVTSTITSGTNLSLYAVIIVLIFVLIVVLALFFRRRR